MACKMVERDNLLPRLEDALKSKVTLVDAAKMTTDQQNELAQLGVAWVPAVVFRTDDGGTFASSASHVSSVLSDFRGDVRIFDQRHNASKQPDPG